MVSFLSKSCDLISNTKIFVAFRFSKQEYRGILILFRKLLDLTPMIRPTSCIIFLSEMSHDLMTQK